MIRPPHYWTDAYLANILVPELGDREPVICGWAVSLDLMAGSLELTHPDLPDTQIYATPGWEGSTAIVTCIMHSEADGADVLVCDDLTVPWTGDLARDTALYVAALARFLSIHAPLLHAVGRTPAEA